MRKKRDEERKSEIPTIQKNRAFILYIWEMKVIIESNISKREINMSSVSELENRIRERYENDFAQATESMIEQLLRNRPRYSKRIPKKIYMKFHTLEIVRWEIECLKIPWEWVRLTQENWVRLKFKFLPSKKRIQCPS